MSTADPNVVIVTGENPFIRLSATDSDDYTTNASFWRIIFSPAGPGHVLYLKSELTENKWRIYADNIAMARWLQTTVQGMLNAELLDTTIPVVDAEFSSSPAIHATSGPNEPLRLVRISRSPGTTSVIRCSSIHSPILYRGGATASAQCWCRRLAHDCPATASRRPDSLGSGSAKEGHSARVR